MKRQNIILSMVQFCFLGACAIYFNFLLLFMKEYGYTAMEYGVSQAFTAGVTFILGPLIGYLVDTRIGYKKILVGGLIITSCTAILVPATINNVLVAFVMIIVHSALVRQFPTLIDAYTLSLRTNNKTVNYGFTRGIGSLGEGVFALVMGYFITRWGFGVMFITHAILMLITVIGVLFLSSTSIIHKEREQLSFKKVVGDLLKNKLYLSFLISVIFLNIGLKIISIFSALIVQQLGGGSKSFGMIMFICGLFELPTFVGVTYFSKHMPLKYIYLIGVWFFGMGAYIGVGASTIMQFMIGRTLTSMAYAIYIGILVEYIGKLLTGKLYTTGMAIIVASAGSIAHIFSSLIGGVILDYFGVKVMSGLLVGVFLLTLIAFIPHVIHKEKIKEEW